MSDDPRQKAADFLAHARRDLDRAGYWLARAGEDEAEAAADLLADLVDQLHTHISRPSVTP